MYKDVGLNTNYAKIINLTNGLANFFGACCSPIIVGKINRRPSLIVSSISCGLCLMILICSIEFVVRKNMFEIKIKLVIYVLYNLKDDIFLATVYKHCNGSIVSSYVSVWTWFHTIFHWHR